MIKEKKCKGIGKALSFNGCGKLVNSNTRRFGLCMSCYPKFILETEAGNIIMRKAILKASKTRLDFESKEREHKYKSELKRALSNTKTIVHSFVRERDKGLPCISCGCSWSETFQAGHFYKAELYETLRFDIDNINGQCFQCNIHFDGNINAYSLNLPKRIGNDRYSNLVKKAELDKHYDAKYWDLDKLKEIRVTVKNLKNAIQNHY